MAWLKKNKEKPIEEVAEVPVPKPAEKSAVKEVEENFDEVIVVKELPMQPIRYLKKDDGRIAKLITIEEALTLQLNE